MDVDAILATAARHKAETDRWAALDYLRTTVQVSKLDQRTPRPQLRRLSEALAEQYAELKMHREAAAVRQQQLMLPHRGMPAAEAAMTLAGLVTDLYLSHQFEEAMGAMGEIWTLRDQLPDSAVAVLLRLESTVMECKGDLISALQRFEESLRLTAQPQLQQHQQHMDLLARTLRQERGAMPPEVAGFMQKRLDTLGQQLVRQGPWERLDQMPGNYIPGLSASAWRRAGDFDEPTATRLKNAQALLREQTAPLRAEFLSLRAAGLLHRERECIHEAGAGFGSWERFEVTGFWRRQGPNGCAVDAPVACALFHALQRPPLSLQVIRAGYSALEAGARLKPHFGMTNGQLKFHLGLIVPRQGGGSRTDDAGLSAACATFTVGGETRAWSEGEVLFFDDSFTHSVNQTCASQRVVFQVVFAHPDLVRRVASDMAGKARDSGAATGRD